MLSEDTLLEIFYFYRLDATKQSRGRPWKWHRLAHVCRRWRYVITVSPRRLGLQILCKSGAAIGSTLDVWPTLPLVVRSKAPKSKSLPNNIIVALRRPDRVCEIDLTLSSSLIGSIVKVIQEPLPSLECIRITVKNATGQPMVVRGAFLGGPAPHLREISLDGVAFPFPEIQQTLLSTNNIVELHLSSIPNELYFLPTDLVTGLSTLVQLKRLTVGFHSPVTPVSSLLPSMTPPRRTTLPLLSFLDFHGASEYLEDFVARIDLPALSEITIRLFNQIFFEFPQFCRFIPRLNALGSPTSVMVTHLVGSVGVFFFQEGNPSNENCFLGTSCRRLDWQLSFATQISSQLSPLFSNVRLLVIQRVHELPTREDVDTTQWLEFFQPFTQVTEVHVWEKQLVPGIVQALIAEDMATGVLPELTLLRLSGYLKSISITKAAEQFIAMRRLTGHTVSLLN